MKASELIEDPQQIRGVDSAEVKKSIDVCLKNINSSVLVFDITKTAKVYEYKESDRNGYYFLFDSSEPPQDRIGYFVKYSAVNLDASLSPSPAIKQVLVWRNPSNLSLVGIAKKVFWEYLLPKYGCLASDSQQTIDGQRFWSSAVGDALLHRGLSIRIIDTNLKTFTDVNSISEFKNAVPGTWGTTSWFQRKIVVIFS